MSSTTLNLAPPLNAGPRLASRPALEQVVIRLSQIYLAVWFCSYLVSGLRAAFWFNGYPVNGPFQLYDPLRRLAAGQHAGTDFQFFHGIGVPFLHYPLFWLFGGHSLIASELSRQFTSLLLFVGSLAFFLWAVYRNTAYRLAAHRFLRSPYIAAAAIILSLEVVFPRSAEPGHSLVSGRSTMPLLVFAVVELRLGRWWKAMLSGFIIGAAFVFGTEHGISLALALLAITALSVIQAGLLRNFSAAWENICFLAVSLAAAFASGAALLISFCGIEGARRALHFNLVELPADQFWFFGSPPMPYLTSLRQLVFDHHVILCFIPSLLLVVLLAVMIGSRWRKPLRTASDWGALAAWMLIYAVLTAIPLIGILSRHYVFPQTRIFLLVATLSLAHGWLDREFLRRPKPARILALSRLTRMAALCFIALLGLSTLSLAYRSIRSASATIQHYRQPASYSRSLDENWNAFLTGATRVIDTRRTRPQVSLWSEYAALLDAHYGTFQPAEDYIIHTVGEERWQHYQDVFRRTNPEFVTTMTSQFSFAEWLQNERWEFYEELLNNYVPAADVEHATVWQRRPGPWIESPQNFEPLPLAGHGESVVIPAASSAEDVVVVEIHYQISNPWKKLPLLGGTPRYLARLDGSPRQMSISFPPYRSSFEFPVVRTGSHPVKIDFHTDSFLPGARFEVQSVGMRELPFSRSEAVLFAPRHVPSRY